MCQNIEIKSKPSKGHLVNREKNNPDQELKLLTRPLITQKMKSQN